MLSFMFSKNSPDKLMEAYSENSDQETRSKIVTRLIELNSEEYLEKILERTYYDQAFNYLFQKNYNNPKKLFEYFPYVNNDAQSKIAYRLIDLNAELLIRKLIRTDFESLAIDYFLAKSQNDINELIDLLKQVSSESQLTILNYIVSLKNAIYIKKLYQSDYKEKLLEAMTKNLMSLNSMNDELLLSQEKTIREEIIQRLLKQKIQGGKSLISIDYLQIAILKTHDCDINEFLLFWEPFIPILSMNDSLLKYFFYILNDRQKLYMLLWHYGIENYIKVPNLKYNIDVFEEYYYAIQDCIFYDLKHLSVLFDKVFQDVVGSINYKLGILAYLLDKEKFRFCLEDAEIFIEEMIDNAYDQTKTSDDYSFVEEEINILIFQKNFEKLKDIAQYPNQIYEQVIFRKLFFEETAVVGKKIDLSFINDDSKVVKDIEIEKNNLLQHQEKMISKMGDQKTIQKMKEIVSKKISHLIDLNDFLFSLHSLNFETKDDNKLIDTLMSVVSKSNDTFIQKAVMKRALLFDKHYWADILSSEKFDMNDAQVAYYFNYLIHSQTNYQLIFNILKTLSYEIDISLVRNMKHLMECSLIAISQDSRFVASAGKEKTVFVLDLTTDTLYKYYHNTEIIQLSFTPDSRALCSESKDYLIKFFNLTSFEVEESFKRKTDFELISFNHRGNLIIGKKENELRLFDYEKKTCVLSSKHTHYIQSAVISSDDLNLVSYTNYELKLFKVNNPEKEWIYKSTRAINSLEISANSRYLIVGSGDRWKGEVKLFEVEGLKEIYGFEHDSCVSSVAISKCIQFFAVLKEVKEKSHIIIYDMDFKKEVFSYSSNYHNYRELKFWPEKKYLLAISDYQIDVFDYQKKILFNSLSFDEIITDCKISRDGQWIVVSILNEVQVYYLLDIACFAAYNLLQNFLSFRLEQDSNSIEFLLKNKEKLCDIKVLDKKDRLKDIINYLT